MSISSNGLTASHGASPQIQEVAVLGSTGSIGKNTLDVIARHPDRFKVFALTGAKQVELLFEQCMSFHPEYAVMVDGDAAKRLQTMLHAAGSGVRVLSGASALDDVASHARVHTVMAAIVGSAGLSSCLAAARAGKRLLLANKEALVVGGELFLSQVQAGGAKLIPIDSEHSAIYQSLPEDPSTWSAKIEKIILTASGGPFRERDPSTLHSVTPQEACRHPNWVMGQKISVDSATMMNKCLELIEAHYLFDIHPDHLEVVIHPQSIVHSMVQYRDTSVLAQLGSPDMRVPIAFGLGWPHRIDSGSSPLAFHSTPAMTFESVETPEHQARFPGLHLARQVLGAKGGSTGVLNAANEEAVQAFLEGRIKFTQIHEVNVRTLDRCLPEQPRSLEDLLDLDRRARRVAKEMIDKHLSST